MASVHFILRLACLQFMKLPTNFPLHKFMFCALFASCVQNFLEFSASVLLFFSRHSAGRNTFWNVMSNFGSTGGNYTGKVFLQVIVGSVKSFIQYKSSYKGTLGEEPFYPSCSR